MGDIYQIDNLNIYYPSSRRTSTSKIETCSADGERIDICNDAQLDEDLIVSLICPSLGFGTDAHFAIYIHQYHYYVLLHNSVAQGYVSMYGDISSLSSSGQFAVDIDCIDNAYSFQDCNYTVSDSCSGSPLVLECFSGIRYCHNAYVRMILLVYAIT